MYMYVFLLRLRDASLGADLVRSFLHLFACACGALCVRVLMRGKSSFSG